MLIGYESIYDDPIEWDWAELEIAPFVYVIDSIPITRHETPFDQELIKEWEGKERRDAQWQGPIHQTTP